MANKGFIEHVTISPQQRKKLRRLANSSDYDALKEVAAELLQTQSYDLLSRNDTKEEKYAALDEAEGGYRFWKRLQALITKAAEPEENDKE